MAVFVGLDCGGSSSRVLAIDESGKVLFRGQAGPANLLSTPKASLLFNLKAATNGAPSPSCVCGCFAGLVDEEVREKAVGLLRQIFPRTKRFRAEPDYVAALAACGANTDACVIAGTGSIVCSWQDGAVAKSGGRGPVLGDPGSAAQIGKRRLNAYLNGEGGTSQRFVKTLVELFGSPDEKAIIVRLYASPSPAALLARLGKAVAADAAGGSAISCDIVSSEMAELARMLARHIAGKSEVKESVRVGLAGGLWKCSPFYKEAFDSGLSTLDPDMTYTTFVLRRPPVEGAAQLAKEMAIGY